MSQAEALLRGLSEPTAYSTNSDAVIVIGDDRRITVPDSLKRIAVQYDHNIETVTFDCPRFWDGHDMSQMKIYINYMRPNETTGQYLAQNIQASGKRMTFDWTISRNISQYKGKLSILVCIKKTDAAGDEENHWNSELNQDLYVSEGLECSQTVVSKYPDIITQLLARMDEVEAIATPEAMQAYAETWLEENHERVLEEINNKAEEVLSSIPADYSATAELAEEGARDKANAIEQTATDEVICVTDSADAYLPGLKLYGKTEQYVTTGKQLFDAFTNEIFNTKAVYTIDGDNITYVSNEPYMVLRLRVDHRNLVAGKTYVMECDSITKGLTCQLLGNNVEAGQSLIDARLMNGNTRVEFTIPETVDMSIFDTFNEGVAYLAMSLFVSETSYIQVVQEIKGLRLYAADNPMTEWEAYSGGLASPSPQYPMALRSIESPTTYVYGSNMFPIQEAVAVGLTGTPQPDGSVHYTGTATENAWHAFQQCQIYRTGTYTLTVETKNKTTKGSLVQVFEPGNMVGRTWANTLDNFDCTFEARAGGFVRVCIGVNKGDSVNLTIKIGLTPGDTTVDWLPHVPDQSIEVSQTLHGIPVSSGGNYTDSNGKQWICDEIDFERGVYVQRVGSVTFADATWSQNSSGKYFCNEHRGMFSNEYSLMCTHIRGGVSSNGNLENVIFINANRDIRMNISLDDSSVENVAYVMNDAVLCGVLATPIETSLTAEEIVNFKALRTNYPGTTILNDAGAHMAVKYAADTKKYIDTHSIAQLTSPDGTVWKLTVSNDGTISAVKN